MKKTIILLAAIALCINTIAQDYGQLYFNEEFIDNSNGWPEKIEDDLEVKIDSGHCIIKRKKDGPGAYIFLNTTKIDFATEDFVVETKIKQTEGDLDKGFGLRFCNMRDLFTTSSGKYKVNHYNSKGNDITASFTENTDLVNVQGQYNTYRVEKKANTMRYYLNDVLVGFNGSNEYYTNGMGFYVIGNSTIHVDYFKIWTSPLNINFVENPLEDVIIESLGRNINTSFNEKMPVISPDGKTLFFTRSNPNVSLANRDEDVYYSTLENDSVWSVAKSIGLPINNKGKNSVSMVLPDGNTLLLMNTYNPDGTPKGGGISITKKTDDGWELPTNIEIDYQNRSRFASYCISPSGKVLICSWQRDETVGGRDLYVSFKTQNDEWSKPIGIGLSINTVGDESSAFIASDNKTLYFTSNGHPGLGNSDVFVSRRLDDSWTNWSRPENLGSGINSKESEYAFIISAKGDYAYLQKNIKIRDGGHGGSDIFRVKLSESAKPEPIVFIKGKVFDSETKLPLAADIIYEDLNKEEEIGVANSEPKEGQYQIALPYGKVYGFLAKKEGYFPISQNIDLKQKGTLKTITQDLYLNPLKKGVSLRLNNIFFDNNESELKETSYNELDRLISILNDQSTLKIEIAGHTDNVGSNESNIILSRKRALAVKNYLIMKGIATDRLTSKGYGEEKPTDSNESEEGKAENRRVEFTIL